MLSENIVWIDIDPREWQNLWNLLYGPHRDPHRLYGLLEGGEPVALIDSRRGQLPLELWPRESSLTRVAAELLRRERTDQVILIERRDLMDLWDRQQRLYDAQADFDEYAFQIAGLNRTWLRDRAICVPSDGELVGYPAVKYEELEKSLLRLVGPTGYFVLGVYEENELWFSLVGGISEGKVVMLTSSLALLDPGERPRPGVWHDTYQWMLRACNDKFGAAQLGIFMDARTFSGMLSSQRPERYLMRAAGKRCAVLDPWPYAKPHLLAAGDRA